MPFAAIGWSEEENEKLVELVQKYPHLYNLCDTSRKNTNSLVTRETTWQSIALALGKPAEECKKRWKCLRDSYMRSKKVGAFHKMRPQTSSIFNKLQFLNESPAVEVETEELESSSDGMMEVGSTVVGNEQVITDNQEYYEITVVDDPDGWSEIKPIKKVLPRNDDQPKKIIKKNKPGRKKYMPLPQNLTPVKILPKPILMNGPRIVSYVEEIKTPEQRSQVIDKLIEKVLKENTNEIDVFFRSMAASVKKLQPSMIPKVKMEVCNVIAKYEMQSFERNCQQ